MKKSARPLPQQRAASARPARTTARNDSRGGTVLGIFIGLVLGMLIALGIAWYLRQAPLPFENKYSPVPPAPANGPGSSANPTPRALPLPGTHEGDAAKPRFDFYGILEGKPTPAPAAEPRAISKTPAAPAAGLATPPAAAAAAAKEVLYLQIGAYQKSADADNMRARLSLLGHDAEILEADVPDKGHVFRVRTGPYASADEMNKARNALAQNDISASLIKIR